MRSASYNMEIRSHVTWKEDNVERMEAQNTSTEKPQDTLQKWMKKTEQQDMNEDIGMSKSLQFP
jgi:hypothetical protein